MSESAIWLALIVSGALTFAQRLSFITAWERLSLPAIVGQALRFVPVAVLVAIIVPELLLPGGVPSPSLANDRLVAGCLATFVAWRTRNMLLTIAIGLAALLLLQTI